MNWKRWKIGLLVAAITGGLTGFIGLAVGVTWRQALFLVGSCVAKDMLLFLKDHPADAVTDTAAVAKSVVSGLLLLAGVYAWNGCATLDPGADPLVVRTEQSLDGATNLFTTIVHVDNANRDFYRSNAPAFHRLAESLRQPVLLPGQATLVPWGEAIIINAWQTKQAYKQARDAGNSNALYLAWVTLNSAYTNGMQELAIVSSTNFQFLPH